MFKCPSGKFRIEGEHTLGAGEACFGPPQLREHIAEIALRDQQPGLDLRGAIVPHCRLLELLQAEMDIAEIVVPAGIGLERARWRFR